MADNATTTTSTPSTREYVILTSGCTHQGARYFRGDKIRLTDETAARLLKHDAIRPADADPGETPAGAVQPLVHDVVGEASTLGASQTVDDAGEIKPSSFGHPDQVAAAEKREEVAARPAARPGRKPAGQKPADPAAAANDGK